MFEDYDQYPIFFHQSWDKTSTIFRVGVRFVSIHIRSKYPIPIYLSGPFYLPPYPCTHAGLRRPSGLVHPFHRVDLALSYLLQVSDREIVVDENGTRYQSMD